MGSCFWFPWCFLLRQQKQQTQVIDPFSILGLELGVTDFEIKKAYRRLSIQYHPDKKSRSSKVMEVFTKAAMEILVRRTDDKPLQKLFMCVRSELNLDLKNMKQDQAKFWKQHPAVVKT
ncbi:PREDICTED: dnaJ protein ERDJ2B-like isoform X3 [Camelina sativa]|uniref:DnaJ protein ERDJ2B-like isoform X3 n=1 Tax=Camelina sativa TaxID=90675 RepID=A0ABM0UHC4_CAMSA|nr:PREDICTED: dnaJ protein ERDJ2B-like isoform X3 [Camelina sativa]